MCKNRIKCCMIFLLEFCGLVEGLNACTTEIKFFFRSSFACLIVCVTSFCHNFSREVIDNRTN